MNKSAFFLLAYFLTAIQSVFTQVQCNKDIYLSYINNEMFLWEEQIGNMEKLYSNNKNIYCLSDLTFAQYGFIVYCIISEQREKGKNFLNKAEKNVNKLLKYDSLWAEIYSLKGALYGFKIEFDKLNAIKYGTKSIKYINTALELDDKNPKVWMEKGNLTYYIPVFLGGGLDKAIKCHEKAVELFEKNPDNLEYNWVYLLVMTNLGRWYTEDGEIKKARELYKKILNFEFNYLWVRDELYPDVL